MVRNDCPAPDVLSAFNLGLLDDGQIETVGRRLDGCPACRDRLAAPAPADADAVCRCVRRADQVGLETPEAGLLRAEELVGRLDANSTTRTPGGADGTARPPPADLAAEAREVLDVPEAPGEIGRLGPFRVLEVVGCGGMGVVFRAADPRLGRTVAVEVLRPHAARQPELCDRFLAEARAVAAVRHDHIIPIYETGEAAGTRLAAGCRDNTIRLFDVARRQQVAELHGHTDYVHSVGWSPDGTRLVSGPGDLTVRVWDSLSAQDRARRGRAGDPAVAHARPARPEQLV